jgi:hypothetical protein
MIHNWNPPHPMFVENPGQTIFPIYYDARKIMMPANKSEIWCLLPEKKRVPGKEKGT